MRFAFLTPGYHPDVVGGAWRYAAEIAVRLADRGHHVHTITQAPSPALPLSEERRGVHLHRFPRAQGWFFKKWRTENRNAQALLRAVLAQGPVDCLALHQAYLGHTFQNAGAPRLFVFHGPWSDEFRFARQAGRRSLLDRWRTHIIAAVLHLSERQALTAAKRIFVASRHFEQQLRRWHPTRLPPIVRVQPGVNTGQFAPPVDRDAVRHRYGIGPQDTVFLAVRRLDPRMGLHLLLEAFATAAASHPNAHLWLTGRGAQEAALKDQIAAAQLQARVRMWGWVSEDELPRILGAADCTVMPSLDLEGFGLATVESLACGTPVLGTRAGATPELLEPFSPQLLVAPNSVAALSDALHAILSGALPLPSRVNCRSFATGAFEWSHAVDAFEEFGRGAGVHAPR